MKVASLLLSTLALGAFTVAPAFAAQTETLHGTVVNYLTTVHASGGVINSKPNSGGISVNSNNAGIHTFGPNTLVQPLGLKASDGTIYLLDASKGNIVSAIAKHRGQSIVVKGHPVVHDGATIFVVDSVG